MIHLRPHAKVNLGLFIKGKRADGYHLLETLLYPVFDLQDELWISEGGQGCEFEIEGIELEGDLQDNLCVRAWKALQVLVPDLPGVKIKLSKRIPAGAGLGGGSSDAAFVLRGLQELFSLDIDARQLHEVAATLGADVPFFLSDVPQLATGTGTDLMPFPIALPGVLRVFPQSIHSSTITAYKALDYTQCDSTRDLRKVLATPNKWKDELVNDLEIPVFQLYPELQSLKDQLYQQGAIYAAMSGSGSAMLAIFEEE